MSEVPDQNRTDVSARPDGVATPPESESLPPGTGPTWGTRGIQGWEETPFPLVASVPQEVLPGIIRVLAPNPGLMTGPGTNTYVLRSADLAVVIDPGPASDKHIEAVSAALSGCSTKAILLTHHHPDHAEGAREFAEYLDAPLAGHPSKLEIDIPLEDGSFLEVGSLKLTAMHTPGHSSDHLCFYLPEERVAFTGDHLMGGNTSVIAPPDGSMRDYLESLRKLGRTRPTFALPGHGQPLPEPVAAIGWYIEHRLERERAILKLLRSVAPEAVEVGEIVEALYSDIPRSVHRIAEFSVWAHLIKLEQEGEVSSVGGEGVRSRWRYGA